jgi:ketosteroid isomerase-like protein
LEIAMLNILLALALALIQPASEPSHPSQPGARESAPALADSDADPIPAIERVLNDFHDAASNADFDRYFSHWTTDSVFLGTDATERWTGDEFREFARPHFEKGKGWTYLPRDRKVTMLGDDAAMFDELLHSDKLGTCRGSGVLRRVDGSWKIMQYNLSIPVPNDLADRLSRMIREFDAVKGEGEDK